MERLPDALSDDAVKARLKWFNFPRGFGFVEPEDGNYDAFLHISTLKRAGVDVLGEGAWLLCLIERRPKGAQVKAIVKILDSGELPEPLEHPSINDPSDESGFRLTGIVKWYKPEKGFGFVIADDGLKDVYLHKNCLDRYGLATIERGTPLEMIVRNKPKGREVVDFILLKEQSAFSEHDEWIDPEGV